MIFFFLVSSFGIILELPLCCFGLSFQLLAMYETMTIMSDILETFSLALCYLFPYKLTSPYPYMQSSLFLKNLYLDIP